MRAGQYALLVALAALWGLSFVFYRVGSPALGPLLFVELRVALASAALVGYLLATGGLRASLGRIRPVLARVFLLGGLNAALPFSMFAIAELVLPASYASILNATTPLFSTWLGVSVLGHPFRARHGLGIVMGLAGVVVLVGTSPFPVTYRVLGSMGLILIAAAAYAVSAIFVARGLRGLPPMELSLGQQLTASVLLLPLALYELPSARFGLAPLEAVAGIALLSTALAFAIYFRLIREVGPRPATTVTMLMPVFGVFWSFLLLGEPVGWGLVAGVVLVAMGVALLTDLAPGWRPWRRPASP